MLRLARTLTNVGIYLILTLLINIMIFSILLISIKPLMDGSYKYFLDLGKWLQSNLDASLSLIKSLGIIILLASFLSFIILILILIWINSRKSISQRFGYIFGLCAGGAGLFISILPAMTFGVFANGDELSILLSLIFFLLMGLSNSLLLTGSIFGILSAKTYLDNYEDKNKSKE
ncbi:hypothetical protein [Spiroplasma cantharicola]|uniref:Uncharacterized protein n=1 Tax=Spiroplasma cantharicola TaxID=362837 RepID=A0A0M5KLJ3_9MOLU|nr:hypothetical protein [Spiroplasma cantharicola]ALD66401.1 hypothetical protein SCANT_v1c04950 [Spiroplasma cantharicola]